MSCSKFVDMNYTDFPKWKIALAVGGAAVLGAGIYYAFYNSKKEIEKKTDSKKSLESKGSSEKVISKDPASAANQKKTEGNKLFKEGKYKEAIALYSEAIDICPSSCGNALSVFFQNRAACYEHLENWEKVYDDCSSSLKYNSRYVKSLSRRARAAEKLGKDNMALEDNTAVCIIESFGNKESLGEVDRILKKLGMKQAEEKFPMPKNTLLSIHTINSYFCGFYCDPVCKSVNDAGIRNDILENVKNNKSHPDGYCTACKLLEKNQFSDIINACDRELDFEDSVYKFEARHMKGMMQVQYNNWSLAMEEFKVVAEGENVQDDLRVAALVKKAALEMACNNSEGCLSTLAKALSIDDKNSDVYHQRGQMYLILNNIVEAIEDFDKVASLSPKFPVGIVQKLHTNYRFASFNGDKSKCEKIIEEFKAAAVKFDKCPEVHLLLSQILIDEERYEEADSAFKVLEKALPDYPAQFVYQGMLHVQWKGVLPDAIKLIKKALSMDPLCEMALENLATISVQTGNLKEGIELFDKAIPLAKSITEMSHYFSLRDAAEAQLRVVERLGILLPPSAEM